MLGRFSENGADPVEGGARREMLSVVAALRGERGAALRLLSDLSEAAVIVGEDTAGAAVDLESTRATILGEWINSSGLVEVAVEAPGAAAGRISGGRVLDATVVASDVDSSIGGKLFWPSLLLLPDAAKSNVADGRPASTHVDLDRP